MTTTIWRPGQPAIERLSDREREVLALMADGHSNLGIEQRLFLGRKTVETHIRSILTRLDIPPDPDRHRRVLAVVTYLKAPYGRLGE